MTETDIKTLAARGITPEAVDAQIQRFVTGFPYLHLLGAATPGAGIQVLDAATRAQALDRWHKYLADGGKVTKMVPASGAASRMFKSLFAFVDGDADTPKEGSDVAQVIANIDRFAFIDDLNDRLRELYGLTAQQMVEQHRFKEVISAIINPEGLNYGNLPKGLLKFHHYADTDRTPLEEQLVEGMQTAADRDGHVAVHFTVSPDHRVKFEQKIAQVVPAMEKKYGKKFDLSLSEQKPSTDTIAVTPDNEPLRVDGHLVFRPGGHGALIENLNDLDATVVFIKNIDNVVPDSQRQATIEYKQVLAGYLITLHDAVASRLSVLEQGSASHDELMEMLAFMTDALCITHPEDIASKSDADIATYIKGKLDRPLRVCGMVRNEGEPGGGPYIAYNADGSASPQILESTQIDTDNATYRDMMAHATHFNPVDLVCYIRDIHGKKYDLPAYVDHSTGFISSKSLHGVPLKALELPGLWNGAMSDWTTVFVEVPGATFNPVKTVNDLLRPVHQDS